MIAFLLYLAFAAGFAGGAWLGHMIGYASAGEDVDMLVRQRVCSPDATVGDV